MELINEKNELPVSITLIKSPDSPLFFSEAFDLAKEEFSSEIEKFMEADLPEDYFQFKEEDLYYMRLSGRYVPVLRYDILVHFVYPSKQNKLRTYTYYPSGMNYIADASRTVQ